MTTKFKNENLKHSRKYSTHPKNYIFLFKLVAKNFFVNLELPTQPKINIDTTKMERTKNECTKVVVCILG
jgi:hypothetical protein